MSQPRPCYRRTSGRRPPLPVPQTHPSAPARWPLVLAAAALGSLLLTLLTVTTWVSAGPRPSDAAPPAAIEPASPEMAQDGPPPVENGPRMPIAQQPPLAEQPPPAGPAPEAVAVALPDPKTDPPPAPAADAPAPSYQNFGTAVAFLNSPTEAAGQADKSQKLLFVLHVSGNFENDCFT